MYKYILISIFAVSVAVGQVIGLNQPVLSLNRPVYPTIELTAQNSLTIRGEMTGRSMSEAQKKFAKLVELRKSQQYPIYIVLDSGGGSVYAGLRFWELVKAYDNVHTITLRGYSMAAMLSQLVEGQRYTVESGEFMFHKIKLSIPESETPEGIVSLVEFVRQTESLVENKVASRAKLTLEFYREKTQHDWFLGASKAIEMGFADSIITLKCSPELLKKKTKVQQMIMPFLPPIEIEISECPIIL